MSDQSPVNANQWDPQAVQDAAVARLKATQSADHTGGGWVPDWLKKPVEWVGSKIHSVYSNFISQPLTTPFLATYMAAAESNSTSEEWGKLFSGDLWDRAYQDSKHVSPGQALSFGIQHFGEGREEFKKSMQQDITKEITTETGEKQTVHLNETGLIWDNPAAVQANFDHGVMKYVSGGLDFASSWFLDPMAIAGKGAGALRDVAYVRPAMLGNKGDSVARGLVEGAAGITGKNQIQRNLNSSAFKQMSDLIMANKTKLGAGTDTDRFGDWVTRQNWAKNSTDGPALANVLGKAKDQDEVNQILAVSMGDKTAMQRLGVKNEELAAQLNMLQRQHDGLVSNFGATLDDTAKAKMQLQIQDAAERMSKIDAQQKKLGKVMDLENSMFNGMYFMPGVSKIASNLGQYTRGLQTSNTGAALRMNGVGTAAMSLAYNNLYVRPLRIVTGTTFNGVRAPGHVNIESTDGHIALDASLDQAKVWSPEQRAQFVTSYLNADQATRGLVLEHADNQTFLAVAAKHGLTGDQAQVLYNHLGGQKAAMRNGRIYSTAEIKTADGGSLRADHVDDAGNIVAVSPVFNTQLENTHILHDYEHLNQVLKLTAKPFQKLLKESEIQAKADAKMIGPQTEAQAARTAQQAAPAAAAGAATSFGAKRLNAYNVTNAMADVMNSVWKFSVLARLGYGPRAIGDDFMGQAARFGAFNMFIDRAAVGGMGQFTRTWNRILGDKTGYEQQLAGLESGIQLSMENIARHQGRVDRLQTYLPGSMTYAGKGAKGRAQMNARTTALKDAQAQLDAETVKLNQLRAQKNTLTVTRAKLGDRYTIMPDGTAFPLPYEGAEGKMFQDLNSGRKTLDVAMGGAAADMWNQMRSGDWRAITRSDKTYNNSWMRVAQYQIAQDKAAMAHLQGQDLNKWFKTPEGRQYLQEYSGSQLTAAQRAERIGTTVDHVLPRSSAEAAAVREAVTKGATDDEVMNLMKQVKDDHAPTSIQAEGFNYGMGKGQVFNALDKMMGKFYDKMGNVPADVLSRNPLFFQLYRQHTSDLWQAAKDGGIEKISAQQQQRIASQARALALKDVKKFTYNMDFESKLAYKMRFIAPFFGPMQESFHRWGRIIADKPDTLSHAANIYTSPTKLGMTVDQDGNRVDQDGYATKPDGTRYLVGKGETHIQFQAPNWVARALGAAGDGQVIDVPLNTLNLVLQNDPWYNPGTGPWVQVPANWAALRSDPEMGDVMQKMGIIQKVTPNTSDMLFGSTPKFLSQVLGGSDHEQQQKDMAYIMQSEDYKFKMGLRDKEPTWDEVKDRVTHAAYLRGLVKTVAPLSIGTKDPYQFFRDQYRQLQQADPKNADQVFLAKYGDAAFVFTGALTSSKKGLPATVGAVRADKEYSYLTDEDPDLAALIVGPYASGDFSQTAYVQQMQSGERTVNDARDVMNKANANLGWAQYDKFMNGIRAEMYQAGITDFSDPRAKAFDNARKAVGILLASPTMPNGEANPNYNPDFAKEFGTTDRTKDDRRAAVFNKLVTDQKLMNDKMRDDIRGLATYMDLRNSFTQVLNNRNASGGSNDINAKRNLDLKVQFHQAIGSLIEQNTLFQSLHDRWLTHDMFDHNDPGLTAIEEKMTGNG